MKMTEAKVVITGGTRGIGFGLAEALLERSCRVVVSGREEGSTRQAVRRLQSVGGEGQVWGQSCDVMDPTAVRDLWDFAEASMGSVGIWVNNAGISNESAPLWEVPELELKAVVETNLLGAMYGCQVAVKGMLEGGGGAIYNMEGMGSDGRTHEGLIPYGTTKYGLDYLTKSLAKELEGTGVIVAALRPGMVVTDLITEPYRDQPEEWKRVKPIFNIIADRVERVAPWLADQILENRANGAVLQRVSSLRMMSRFITRPLWGRNLFEDIEPL